MILPITVTTSYVRRKGKPQEPTLEVQDMPAMLAFISGASYPDPVYYSAFSGWLFIEASPTVVIFRQHGAITTTTRTLTGEPAAMRVLSEAIRAALWKTYSVVANRYRDNSKTLPISPSDEKHLEASQNEIADVSLRMGLKPVAVKFAQQFRAYSRPNETSPAQKLQVFEYEMLMLHWASEGDPLVVTEPGQYNTGKPLMLTVEETRELFDDVFYGIDVAERKRLEQQAYDTTLVGRNAEIERLSTLLQQSQTLLETQSQRIEALLSFHTARS